MTSTSPTATSTPPPKRHRVKYAKAFGYLLDPYLINQQAIKDGTSIQGQLGRTFSAYRNRLAKHCGIKYNDIVTVRNPDPDMSSPLFCLVAATNLSERSRNPRTDIFEKAKEFLGMTEEPKWYLIVRV
ncbi:hypothetical protein BYT27DRAFT_7192799 [Phlegmacium glaucopus]|nr:hypothetical protein BYT27DRAFT_7192799 [Phlegmacium glaucopus]